MKKNDRLIRHRFFGKSRDRLAADRRVAIGECLHVKTVCALNRDSARHIFLDGRCREIEGIIFKRNFDIGISLADQLLAVADNGADFDRHLFRGFLGLFSLGHVVCVRFVCVRIVCICVICVRFVSIRFAVSSFSVIRCRFRFIAGSISGSCSLVSRNRFR